MKLPDVFARLGRLFGAGGVFVCFSLVQAGAVPASSVFPDLHISAWQVENGLPSNKIMDVVQAQSGFIWIATFDGLVRFDGEKFTVFDENNSAGLLDHSLTCLVEGRDGSLWIGHSNGAVTHLVDGRFETITPKNPQTGVIRSIAFDQAGDLWTYSDTGLLTRLKDGFALQPESGIAHLLMALASSSDGKIWVSCAGQLSLLQDGRLASIPLERAGDFVQGICAARDGGLWVMSGNVLQKYKEGKWLQPVIALPDGAPFHVFKETARGLLIAGTSDHGVYLIPTVPGEKIRQLSRANGFASDWILSLCEDREGGLWVGTGGAGLLMIRRTQVDTPAPPDQWQSRAVLSVSPARSGGLWVGTEGAGLYRLHDGQWENYAKGAGIRNPYIWSVVQDGQGTVWIGTWSNAVYRGDDGVFVRAPGLDTMNIPAPVICEAAAGGLWVGTNLGLMLYRDGKVVWTEPESGIKMRDIRAVKEAKDGTVWFGSNGGGLGQIKNGKISHFGKAEGLAGEFLQCLHLDDSGALWIGTSGAGLVRFKDGKFSTLGIDQGLPNAVICDIQEDGRGFLWLSSHAGLLCGKKEDMDRCADGLQLTVDFLSYGLSDGMPSLDCSGGMQPAGCKMPDGRLAFATSKGLAIIDPARIETNLIVPPVAIIALMVDGRDVTARLAASTPIIIPPGSHRLEFQYAGLSFAAPEKVRFKRRLIGLEREWVPVGSKRSADYNYIPPGNYEFQVIACNNDGVWNTTGASLAVTVQPFFWQTLWFKLLMLALLIVASGSLVWFETRRRLQQKLALLEQKRAIANERARIASDMHDDLGSHLTRISMLSETARSGIHDTAIAGDNLKQIYDTARGLTRSMDEIVWAVNPKRDTMDSLVSYLEKFALDFLGAAGIRCRLELPLEYPLWTPNSEVRHNLFLAFKESLNNAAKHSGADLVQITLHISETDYTLLVEDNGRGFVVTTGSSSGNGLGNIRRRMERINGRCEISSSSGHGTKVTLIAPADIPQKT